MSGQPLTLTDDAVHRIPASVVAHLAETRGEPVSLIDAVCRALRGVSPLVNAGAG